MVSEGERISREIRAVKGNMSKNHPLYAFKFLRCFLTSDSILCILFVCIGRYDTLN